MQVEVAIDLIRDRLVRDGGANRLVQVLDFRPLDLGEVEQVARLVVPKAGDDDRAGVRLLGRAERVTDALLDGAYVLAAQEVAVGVPAAAARARAHQVRLLLGSVAVGHGVLRAGCQW